MTKHIYRLSVEICTDEPFKDIYDSVHAGLSMMRFPRDYSTIIRDESYNGWANRETWALNLWLSNDQRLYEMTRERVAEAVGDYTPGEYGPETCPDYYAGEAVRDLWEELTDPDEQLMSCESILEMVRDVGSDYRVDWDEIGQHWLQDVTEEFDLSSSASRQHYIDTGEYLRKGEAE